MAALATANDRLLKAVRSRTRKRTRFGYGITTADRFVGPLLERLGSDECYRLLGNGKSFDDLLQKSMRTLTYSHPRMVVEEKRARDGYADLQGKVALPKNTLMVFRHKLTTSTKDRDGDTLHSDGAQVDPKMLLLWQHLHTQPIGKALSVAKQDSEHLSMYSCIVDMNELCHDAAVMIDNDMGRFSHGFRALDFDTVKRRGGSEGFDVKSFEVMEESLVSVPANPDSETEEVILSLVDGGKLTSPILKSVGRAIREKRPVQVSIKYRERLGDWGRELVCGNFADLKAAADLGLVGRTNGEAKDENEQRDEKGATQAGASAKADAASGNKAEEGTEDDEVKKVECPECGEEVTPDEDGECPECGADLSDEAEEKGCHGGKPRKPKMPKAEEPEGVKGGAIKLNAAGMANAKKLVSAGKTSDSEKWEGPSADAGNKVIEDEGIGAYARWFLAVREGADEETKGAYAYPFSDDFETVSRAGLIAIRSRAGQQKEQDVLDAAGKLIEAIDGKKEPEEEKSVKQGRVLSASNEARIRDARDDVDEAAKMDDVSRPCKALLSKASRTLNEVLNTLGEEESPKRRIKEAQAVMIAAAPEDREQVRKLFDALDEVELRAKRVEQWREIKGDKPGHEFRGNQFSGGGGGGGGSTESRANSASEAANKLSSGASSESDHRIAARAHSHASELHDRAAESSFKNGNKEGEQSHMAKRDEHARRAAYHTSVAADMSKPKPGGSPIHR